MAANICDTVPLSSVHEEVVVDSLSKVKSPFVDEVHFLSLILLSPMVPPVILGHPGVAPTKLVNATSPTCADTMSVKSEEVVNTIGLV